MLDSQNYHLCVFGSKSMVDPFVYGIMMAATGSVLGWMLGRGK
jgi:hypothetical protein